MDAKIKLNPDFNADYSEQAIFTVDLLEQSVQAGTITIDYSGDVHKVTLDFSHPYMTNLAQLGAFTVATNILDSHFNPDAQAQHEWSGDLYNTGM